MTVTANPRTTALASMAVFFSAALWGLIWWPIRHFAGLGIDGEWTVIALNLVAALALGLVFLTSLKQQWPHIRLALLVGAITGIAFAFYYAGLIHTSVIRATLLFYLTPVWSTLIGVVWLREPADAKRWIAIAIGLAGLLLLLSGEHVRPINAADAMAFLSGVFWAIGGAVIKRHDTIPVAGMTMLQHLFLIVFTLIIGHYFFGTLAAPDVQALTAQAPKLLAIGLLLFLPAVALLFWASRFLYPGRVGLLMMTEVLVALVSASLLLADETLSPVQWLGAGCIILAGIVELMPKRRIALAAPQA